MKRKTNLFYTFGPDSKFLTFSNYTESLTGNILSTDTKIYPSKFLCLAIHGLNNTTKKLFIEYLVAYYENKLALLRDTCIDNDENPELFMLPLTYLIEAITNITNKNENNDIILNDIDIENNNNIFSLSNKENIKTNLNIIEYIGDITEEDYNGTYTDIICTIDMNNFKSGQLKYSDDSSNSIIKIGSGNANTLYGWNNDNLPDEYKHLKPIYDDTNGTIGKYNFNSDLESINIVNNSNNVLKFNVIIPLYDITDINYNTNFTVISEDESILLKDNDLYRKNVPLGIWLYCEEDKDTFIELKRDIATNMAPSWSLLISTQFKPFPYSGQIENITFDNNIGNSFSTFSQVLSRMNLVLDKFNNVEKSLIALNNRLDEIERKQNILATVENIDAAHIAVVNMSNNIKTEMDNFKKTIYNYIDNIKWSHVG